MQGLGDLVVDVPVLLAPMAAILSNRSKIRADEVTLKLASRDYGKLSADTAERTLRFWLLHNKIEK